ncbi:hypothetical protein BOVA172_5328 [Bacteroides ovatus]|nr:hypothetical protein BOVA172_5328 [Bacteroides ovatus]DAQ13739.1 MAG TPA: response regulator [Caudoviricetes sp.]
MRTSLSRGAHYSFSSTVFYVETDVVKRKKVSESHR